VSFVDDLIAQGAVQVSRKHRKVFIPPADPVQWLKKNDPACYDRLVEALLKRFVDEATGIVWHRAQPGNTYELGVAEFAEFYEKANGKKLWSTADKTPCSGCGSFGHMHRSTCPNNDNVED
jgi:hypothetical protein